MKLFFTLILTLFLFNLNADEDVKKIYVSSEMTYITDNCIIIHYDKSFIIASKIHEDKHGLYILSSEIIDTKSKVAREYLCRKCSESFYTEYQLNRHYLYDHYGSSSMRPRRGSL